MTINADGASSEVKFQANGVEKASISSAGAFTSTTIDATALTGNLPAIDGSSLTGLDTALAYNQGGTGATNRTVENKLQETVSVKDFGAVGDGVTDDTAAIQAAIDASNGATVIAPIGTYVVTDSIIVSDNNHLHLEAGTTIYGKAATSKPVIRVYDGAPHLSGEGFTSVVRTDNVTGGLSSESLEGVINFGSLDETVGFNTNWAIIEGLHVRGSATRYTEYTANTNQDLDNDIGIKCVNPDIFDSSFSASLFNSIIRDIKFSYLGIGLDLAPVVQGNNFSQLYFYRVSLYGLRFTGSKENSVNQTFFHGHAGIVMVKLQTSSASLPYYANRTSAYNSFTNFMGEPGPDGPDGRYARFCEIDAGNNDNYIQGRGNTGHSYINNGNDNSIHEITGNCSIGTGLVTKNLSLYEDTGATVTAYFDSVTERFGVGTSSPAAAMDMQAREETTPVSRQGRHKTFTRTVNLSSGEKARWLFSGANRQGYGFFIHAKGDWTASNTFNNHPYGIVAGNVFCNSSGSTIGSNIASIYDSNFDISNFVFTAVGSGFDFYLDITNPTSDDSVNFTFTIEIEDNTNSISVTSVSVV